MTRKDEGENCDYCDREAAWTWHDGMWGGGRYCDEHIREQLEDRDRFPDHRDEITTAENVTTIGRRDDVRVVPAGARPLKGVYPTIRTKEAFDEYRQSKEAGDRS